MNASVQVNHIGFRPDDPFKRAVTPISAFQSGPIGTLEFQVVQASDLVKRFYNTPAWLAARHFHMGTVENTPLGRYAVCDLSNIDTYGGYQVLFGDARSYPFLVYRDVWKRCFRLLLEWYRVASCGEAVPGYHDVCHLDDCVLADTGEQVDLVGGWHDAGDLRKWTSTMSYVTLALTRFIEEAPADPAAWGVDPDLVWRQIERGAEYLFKMIDPASGLVWHSIASDVNYGNESGVWTDNVPGSGDERGAKRDCAPDTAELHVQTLAALARLLHKRNPELSARTREAALRVWAAVRPLLAEQGGPEASIDACVALWQMTGESPYAEQAAAGLRAVADRQALKTCFGQDALRGFFVRNNTVDGNGTFHRRGGRSLYRHTDHARRFAKALLLWPEHADAGRWRDALTLLLEGCLEPMIRMSPYRALPACLCVDSDCAPGARPLAGRLQFRYFGVEAEGNNGQLAEAAESLALAARALGQPRWAAYGQKQLEWVYGFNPHDTCMMTGLGYSQAAVFSFYVGQVPGAIINGFTGTEDTDEPVLWMNRELSPMNMEYWSVHTAAVLRALSTLENQPLS